MILLQKQPSKLSKAYL